MSISQLSTQCRDLFSLYYGLAVPKSMQPGLIETQLITLNRWVYYDAPTFEGRRLIDWRIGQGSKLYSEIMEVLERLAKALNSKVNDLRTENPEQLTPRESPQQSIGDILDDLMESMRSIHRYHAMRQPVHAFGYVEYDEHTGDNLMSKFKTSMLSSLHKMFKGTSEEMISRLHTTMYLRHQHFCLLKAKLGAAHDPELIDGSAPMSPPPTPERPSGVKRLRNRSSSRRRASRKVHRGDRVRKSPTRMASAALAVMTTRSSTNQPPQTEKQISEQLLSKPDVSSVGRFPSRPKMSPGCSEMYCPYCCRSYPAQEFTEENWPRHVTRDLMPFVCVMQSCPMPNAMFESYEEWTRHMEQHHSPKAWICRKHTPVIHFKDKEAFKSHMIGSHGAHFITGYDAIQPLPPTLLPFQPLKRCPLCDHYDSEHDGESVHEHIARHLISLSLMSLPKDFLRPRTASYS
ncbi:hypothetical protein TgHK011_008305 [Trichoderma gracile]|nr:hypothetical protein TgHK011_008305 [Trichoderma gracile]